MIQPAPRCKCGVWMAWSVKDEKWFCAEEWLDRYTGGNNNEHGEVE